MSIALPFIVLLLIVGIAAGIAIWKHRENIKRLRKGFEPKLSLGKGEKP